MVKTSWLNDPVHYLWKAAFGKHITLHFSISKQSRCEANKSPQTLLLSYWVSCSCRFIKAQRLQIFICLAEVPLPAYPASLWRIISRQWKLLLGNLFLGQESDYRQQSVCVTVNWLYCVTWRTSTTGVMCIYCNLCLQQHCHINYHFSVNTCSQQLKQYYSNVW